MAQILEKYRQFASKNNTIANDTIQEVLDGLKLYFDHALGTILLYRYERQQYTDITAKYPGKPVSEIYGAEHLLRLFGNLKSITCYELISEIF